MSLDVSWNANKTYLVQPAQVPASPRMCVCAAAFEITVFITGCVLDLSTLRPLRSAMHTESHRHKALTKVGTWLQPLYVRASHIRILVWYSYSADTRKTYCDLANNLLVC